jgi:hypothetical protein
MRIRIVSVVDVGGAAWTIRRRPGRKIAGVVESRAKGQEDNGCSQVIRSSVKRYTISTYGVHVDE